MSHYEVVRNLSRAFSFRDLLSLSHALSLPISSCPRHVMSEEMVKSGKDKRNKEWEGMVRKILMWEMRDQRKIGKLLLPSLIGIWNVFLFPRPLTSLDSSQRKGHELPCFHLSFSFPVISLIKRKERNNNKKKNKRKNIKKKHKKRYKWKDTKGWHKVIYSSLLWDSERRSLPGHLPISKSIQDGKEDGWEERHSLSFLSSFSSEKIEKMGIKKECPSFWDLLEWTSSGENGHSFPFPFSISFPFLFYLPLPSRLPVLELICKRKRIGKRRGR